MEATMSASVRTLIFETHATSLDNEAGLASGWYDTDLSETGIRQARELADRYREYHLASVYCSDLLRSRRTAEIAFARRGLVITADRRLRECDYGALTRCPVARIESLRLDCVTEPFPDGESYEQAARRVNDWLGDIREIPVEHPVIVIGHRATFYALQHLLTGAELATVIAAPWHWQPGWHYQLSADS
jgi:broad specificity phosphatase PhoE